MKDKRETTKRVGINSRALTFRDVNNLLTNFIRGIPSTDTKIAAVDRLDELRKLGCTYPAQYLLSDFCLAALDEDYLNTKLFLAHVSQIIGLSNPIVISNSVYNIGQIGKENPHHSIQNSWSIWSQSQKFFTDIGKK